MNIFLKELFGIFLLEIYQNDYEYTRSYHLQLIWKNNLSLVYIESHHGIINRVPTEVTFKGVKDLNLGWK